MQKRFQVMLPDWMDDYIQHAAKLYGASVSELLRLETGFAILFSTYQLYPEFRKKFDIESFFKGTRGKHPKEMGEAEFERRVSKLFFEARKAVEFRLEKEKKGR